MWISNGLYNRNPLSCLSESKCHAQSLLGECLEKVSLVFAVKQIQASTIHELASAFLHFGPQGWMKEPLLTAYNDSVI